MMPDYVRDRELTVTQNHYKGRESVEVFFFFLSLFFEVQDFFFFMEWAMGKGKSVTVINAVEEGERGGDTPHVRMRDGMVLH